MSLFYWALKERLVIAFFVRLLFFSDFEGILCFFVAPAACCCSRSSWSCWRRHIPRPPQSHSRRRVGGGFPRDGGLGVDWWWQQRAEEGGRGSGSKHQHWLCLHAQQTSWQEINNGFARTGETSMQETRCLFKGSCCLICLGFIYQAHSLQTCHTALLLMFRLLRFSVSENLQQKDYQRLNVSFDIFKPCKGSGTSSEHSILVSPF